MQQYKPALGFGTGELFRLFPSKLDDFPVFLWFPAMAFKRSFIPFCSKVASTHPTGCESSKLYPTAVS